MKWIREYFIKKALMKKQKKGVKKEILVAERIKSITVIADNAEDLKEVFEVLKSSLGEQIHLGGIFYDEKSQDERAFGFKDFSLIGKPGEKITNFLSEKQDLIIFTSESLNNFTLYLLHQKPEPYTIGFYRKELKPYLDLMLNKEVKDIKAGTEHLIKYLKQIN
jgi:hypothetical protein